MKKTKKILSIILAVMMILTAVPLTGMTAFAVSDGERIDPGKYGLMYIDNPLHDGDDRVEFTFSDEWFWDGYEGGITEIYGVHCTKYIDTDEYYDDYWLEPEQYSCEWIYDGFDYILLVYDITEPGLYSVWIDCATLVTLDAPYNIYNVWFDFYIPETNGGAFPVSHDEPVFSCSYENGAVSLDFDSVAPMFRNDFNDLEVFMDGNSVPANNETYKLTFECPFEPGTSKHIEIPFVGLDYSTSSYYHSYYFNIDTTLYFNKDGTVTAGYSTDPEEPTHEHVFSTEWTKNETAHWHVCTAVDCDIEDYSTCGLEGAAYAAHTFTGDLINYEDNKWAQKCVCGAYDTANTKTGVAVPTATTGLVYNGEEQTGVMTGEGYTVTNGKATEAGDYTATVTLKDGYIWADGTTAEKKIEWKILTVTDYHILYETCDSFEGKGGKMGHQDKIGAEGVGRTIICLTEEQLAGIGDYVTVVGGDLKKETTVTLDCAYTYFYAGNTKYEAKDMGYAAFLIIDCDAYSQAISGYGYYAVFNGDSTDSADLIVDALYAKPNN